MELKGTQDLFRLTAGDSVSKRNLFGLIQYSKVPGSDFWSGEELKIGNTPQQGINWVGVPPACRAVILKTRPGSYAEDGWTNEERTAYRYSFKARDGVISHAEKANAVLIHQPRFRYPVLLFTETKSFWSYEGAFDVSAIDDRFVVLVRHHTIAEPAVSLPGEGPDYREGGLRYVTHLMAERSRDVVRELKERSASECEICRQSFAARYGVECIEAHHKVPISTYSSEHTVRLEDLALLCPNCHRAVHIYMKKWDLEYPEIRERLASRLAG
ncbi:HNH endonuclease [Stutzerimonas nitrititolerans]|uniref:HNH endonuclease n=1 Tax=Stutzerimonas nitrititolerans TaxID=2482751 RepID=UPI0028ADC6E4|nr:HNH endonuclease [Stutzerimonas nitrititolerans]